MPLSSMGPFMMPQPDKITHSRGLDNDNSGEECFVDVPEPCLLQCEYKVTRTRARVHPSPKYLCHSNSTQSIKRADLTKLLCQYQIDYPPVQLFSYPVHYANEPTKMPQAEVKGARRPSQETLDVKSAQTSPPGDQSPKPEEDPMELVVTRSVVESIMKVHDPSLTVVDFTAEAGSNVGDNYMAIMYALKVNVKKPGSDKVHTHSIMLKTMPLNPMRQQMANDAKIFVKEVKMYGAVLRDLDVFQKDLGLAENEVYADYPFCYATLVDGKGDYLAMENLKTSGFVMADRTLGLDHAHATLALKSLARFHALSYVKFRGSFQAIMDTYPELEDAMWSATAETATTAQLEMMKMFVGQSLKNVIAALRTAGYESEADIVEGPHFQVDTVLEKMRKCSSLPCKHAVIGHSDAWTNNMLFKYDAKTGQLTGIKLIDFQLSHPCSRTLDLLYFLNGCLREELVNVAEKELLKIYYDEFSAFATRLGFLDPELTYEQLLQEFDENRYFGVIMALMVMPIFYANKADVKNMEDFKGEMNEENVAEFFGGLANATAARRVKNILNVQLPKLKL